jgi:hypothetical protein
VRITLPMKHFTTRQVLTAIEAASGGGIDLDNERLKDWYRRRIIESDPAGKGNERLHTFAEVAYIASLALFADRTKNLRKAREAAKIHARLMTDCKGHAGQEPGYLVKTGGVHPEFIPLPAGDKPSAQHLALAHGSSGPVLVHPAQFAVQLLADLESDDTE